MKVLVTGKNGKIGMGFRDYIRENKQIETDCISLRGEQWKEADLTGYDAVYYCIGVVDESSEQMENINVTLTLQFAQKVKESGVKTFVYLSSMAVYDFESLPIDAEITKDTPAVPKSRYGKSKLAGEEVLLSLADDNFHIHNVRAPSIYGRATEAYLDYYEHIAQKGTFIDAFHKQKRSAIYIDNLSELIFCICSSKSCEPITYYYPQNKERYSVSDFVHAVTKYKKIKCKCFKLPTFLQTGFFAKFVLIKRIKRRYRSIAYASDLSNVYDYGYCVVSTDESIHRIYNDEKSL